MRSIFEPLVTLLLNQEFGLLFWAYIPAAIWAWRTKQTSFEHRRLLRLLIGFGLIWMAFISINASVLYVVPRYYAPFSWAASIIVVYWLKEFLFVRWPRVAVLAGVGLLTTNLFCVYVENKNPLFAERALVEYMAHHRGVVYTDPMTLTRAKLLFEFRGISADRVLKDPAPAGAVFYASSNSIERCKRASHKCKWSWDQYLPSDTWIEFSRIQPQRKVIGVLLSFVGLDKVIPEEILKRLNTPNSDGRFYIATPK